MISSTGWRSEFRRRHGESTKEKVRYAALMAGLKQAELVEQAVEQSRVSSSA